MFRGQFFQLVVSWYFDPRMVEWPSMSNAWQLIAALPAGSPLRVSVCKWSEKAKGIPVA